MKKTTREIHNELEKIMDIKDKVPHYSDDINNWDLVSAQVQVLKFGLEMNNIVRQFSDDDNIFGAAEDALYWVNAGSVLSPSDSWKDLIKLQKPAVF